MGGRSTGRGSVPQNSGTTAGNRPPEGRRFVKGRSGNPGGRPRGLVAAIREHTKDGEQLVDFMLRVFRGEFLMAKLRDRIDAATWLADRGFGRPVQGLNVETYEIDLTRLTDEQLERIARGEHPAVVVGTPSQG